MQVKIVGQVIGTADGWDEAGDTGDIQFYNFVSSNKDIPSCATLFVSLLTGELKVYDSKDIETTLTTKLGIVV